MDELIERLEKATEPDREIDLAIAVALQPEGDIAKLMGFRRGFDGREGMAWDLWANAVCFEKYTADGQCFFNGGYPLPQYTTSIDAALTLVPENGRLLELGQWQDNGKPTGWFAQVTRWLKTGEHSWLDKGFAYGVPEQGATELPKLAPNGAIALCIAALKARDANYIQHGGTDG
jgi:hypothetical protein